jgi:hypothetical protein
MTATLTTVVDLVMATAAVRLAMAVQMAIGNSDSVRLMIRHAFA